MESTPGAGPSPLAITVFVPASRTCSRGPSQGRRAVRHTAASDYAAGTALNVRYKGPGMHDRTEVTALLLAWNEGDPTARSRLIDAVMTN